MAQSPGARRPAADNSQTVRKELPQLRDLRKASLNALQKTITRHDKWATQNRLTLARPSALQFTPSN